ncbi:hypothetical protein TNCV_726501 [Trichonephila clavipes]|nr:hypothetical protein TNCV_726501 [Trichonephila clavipes]
MYQNELQLNILIFLLGNTCKKDQYHKLHTKLQSALEDIKISSEVMEKEGLSEFKGEGSSSLKLSCNEQEQFPLGELNDCMNGRNSPESNVVVDNVTER